MNLWKILLAILFPPLSVVDRSLGIILMVIFLTLMGWIPGVIAAFIILGKGKR